MAMLIQAATPSLRSMRQPIKLASLFQLAFYRVFHAELPEHWETYKIGGTGFQGDRIVIVFWSRTSGARALIISAGIY